MISEPEARKKICPHLPVDTEQQFFTDTQYAMVVSKFALCVASDCMQWRKVDQVGIGPNGEKRDRDMDGRTRWVDRGYCGLAGAPPTVRLS